MATKRALHLFDLVSYINSADSHCCTGFPATLCMDPELRLPLVPFVSAI